MYLEIMLNYEHLPQKEYSIMLNNLSPVQAFSAGFVAGAVTGSLATYFVTRPSAESQKILDEAAKSAAK
jgi:hypothetical protein